MAFLKTLFWIVLTVVLVVFASRNWTIITINLWGGLQADAKLPVLLLIAFLAGFVPTYAAYRAALWRYGRRLAATERALAPTSPAEPSPASPPVSREPF